MVNKSAAADHARFVMGPTNLPKSEKPQLRQAPDCGHAKLYKYTLKRQVTYYILWSCIREQLGVVVGRAGSAGLRGPGISGLLGIGQLSPKVDVAVGQIIERFNVIAKPKQRCE